MKYLILALFLVSCSPAKPTNPCDAMPHSTKQERQDKALCENR